MRWVRPTSFFAVETGVKRLYAQEGTGVRHSFISATAEMLPLKTYQRRSNIGTSHRHFRRTHKCTGLENGYWPGKRRKSSAQAMDGALRQETSQNYSCVLENSCSEGTICWDTTCWRPPRDTTQTTQHRKSTARKKARRNKQNTRRTEKKLETIENKLKPRETKYNSYLLIYNRHDCGKGASLQKQFYSRRVTRPYERLKTRIAVGS